jgi:putative MATE family efflux protein
MTDIARHSPPLSAAPYALDPSIGNPIVTGPIIPTLVRLALPTIAVLVVQTLVGIAEILFVSRLGTDALAGVTLVFPVLMLVIATANAGIGGGVASAAARALGRQDKAASGALAWHAIVLGAVFGVVLAALALLFGPRLYETLGGKGAALDVASGYSAILFIGSPGLWIMALLSAGLRGAGDVRTPALVVLLGAGLTLVLSPLLIFGLGPVPALGVNGAAISVTIFYVAGTALLLWRLTRPNSPLPLRIVPINPTMLRDILGVGSLAAVGTSLSNITLTLITGAAGVFGVAAIAGYGIATRLDSMLIPILFGLGSGVVTMVGAALGAGDVVRARKVTLIGAAIGAAVSGIVGTFLAVYPDLWSGLFTSDPLVHASSADYLRIVGPFYVFLGAGLIIFFAGQGARKVGWPVALGVVRLLIAGVLGWWVSATLGGPISSLSTIVATSLAIYGLGTIAAFLLIPWRADGPKIARGSRNPATAARD